MPGVRLDLCPLRWPESFRAHRQQGLHPGHPVSSPGKQSSSGGALILHAQAVCIQQARLGSCILHARALLTAICHELRQSLWWLTGRRCQSGRGACTSS